MAEVYIALGSNLNNPQRQLDCALESLAQHSEIELLAVSHRYRTPPIGPEQPDFINAAAQLRTALAPLALLDALQRIEQQQNRQRDIHWGPRTLDLDILLYDNIVLDSERLTIPHRLMGERAFVLVPLADLNANLMLPSGKTVAQLLANCSREGIVKADSTDQ
jgi:2-amino-4-hydroxy-6-hydroxymethyldihydropteridine diphosphokinase